MYMETRITSRTIFKDIELLYKRVINLTASPIEK